MNASCLSEYGLQSSGVRRFGEPRWKPILFADIQNTMAIAREENFGPALSIIAYVHENGAVRIARLWIGRVRDFGRPQGRIGFRSEFDQATFTSVAHGPTLAVVLERTNSWATVGDGVRPGSKNSLSSRPSLGTWPPGRGTLGQRSHPKLLKGTLNGAVVNLSLRSEKHCRAIGTVL
jgi:Aldehyde dehydrogenase family